MEGHALATELAMDMVLEALKITSATGSCEEDTEDVQEDS